MRSINVSASSIKDFLVCSKRYYYRINNSESGIPTLPMKVGTLVHKVMESAYGLDYKKALELGNKEIEVLGLVGEEKEFALNKLKLSLEHYYKFFNGLVSSEDQIEKYFKISIGTNVNMVGRIDRLNTTKKLIIDWKTSQRDPFQINTDIQFLLYKHAYSLIYKEKPVSVLYANLFTGKLLSLVDEEYKNYHNLFDSTIPTMVSRIKIGDIKYEGLKKKNACNSCPFKQQCEMEGGRK
jgi:CRISPR/Cas system-associated exonuclease Cas4 (RecB family)